MAGREGDKERLTAEEEAERAKRTRLTAGYSVAAVLVLAAAALIVVLAGSGGSSAAKGDAHINFNPASGSTNGVAPDERVGTPPPPVKVADLASAAKRAGCKLRLHLPDEGHAHIPPTAQTPEYGTNPPTSGAHVEAPYQQADGAYAETPAEIAFVHSLEHGRLEIQYSPQLPERDQLLLKGVFDTMYGATLLFPNERMPYEVAATTWTNLIGCPTYKGAITLDAIRDFGRESWGKYGGEPVHAFKFTGPTPAKPAE